ncbi:MAG: RHS repeat-associated core domain-containing protein [Planctomycetota bacterium]
MRVNRRGIGVSVLLTLLCGRGSARADSGCGSSAVFEIVEGGPHLVASVQAPPLIRPGRDYIVWLNYSNDGDGDMPAPLFTISSPQNPLMRLSDKEPFAAGPVQVLGVNPDGPAGLVPPGFQGRIPIHFRAPSVGGGTWVSFHLRQMVADAAPVDWDEIEPLVHPADIDPGAWDAIWSQLTADIGSTWADYLAALSADADYLQDYGAAGAQVYDVRRLLAMEISQAGAAGGARRVLDASVDAYSSARILPLVFARTAYSPIDQRYRNGPLGRGWSHNYEYALTRPETDRIRITGPGGSVRSFTKVGSVWQAQPGDFGVLSEPSGGYLLREKDGLTWRFDGTTGLLSYLEEPNGNRLTLAYAGNLLATVTHSNGQSLGLAYDGQGRITELTDPAGRPIAYTYDGEHLASVTHPGGRVTSYVNNPAGGPAGHALTEIGYPDGTHQYCGYDTQGRLAAQWRDGNSERVDLTYDNFCTVILSDATTSGVATLRLGAFGEPLEAEDANSNAVRLEYDSAFNIPKLTDPGGRVWEATYDSKGNPSSLRDALGKSVTLTNTVNFSRLDALMDQRGNLSDFQTDTHGNLTRMTYPNGKYEEFGYDGVGNVTSVRNRRGQTVTFAYDTLGQVTQKAYPGGRTVSFTYDTRGNLLTAADSVTGTITMEYDDRDFLTRVGYPTGAWFTFQYNNAGRRTRRTSHDGDVLNYAYDTAGRLEYVKDGVDAVIVHYAYDPAGRLSHEDKGNGTYTTYEYDGAGQLEHLANFGSNGAEQSHFDYTYDPNGDPMTMDTLAGTWAYTYDAIGQLTGVAGPSFSATYVYDAAGNRITATEDGVEAAYTTNNMNQYLQAGAATYGFDDDGNLTSKTDASGTTTYTYDAESRLTGVTLPDGRTFAYTYDALGNRTAVNEDGAVTQYVHDPAGLVDVAAEYNTNGEVIARYVHGLGLVAHADSNGLAYYSFDAIGNTRQLTDATGAVVNTYDYAPFGTPLIVNETIPNPFRFVGRFGVADDMNGLTFMRARHYDSSLGRFTSADPLRVAGGVNLYAYTRNPLIGIDPKGLSYSTPSWGQIIADTGQDLLMKTYPDRRLGEVWKAWRTGSMCGSFLNNWYGATSGLDRVHAIGVLGAKVVAPAALHMVPYVGGLLSQFAGRLVDAWDRLTYDVSFAFWMWWGNTEPFRQELAGQIEELAQMAQLASSMAQTVVAWDPNEKSGPQGCGANGFVPLDGEPLAYTVFFENQASASAPAQEVFISDFLDEDLDWTTFQLGEIVFGSQSVTELAGRTEGTTRVALEGSEYVVDIETHLDLYAGCALWTLRTIDPLTEDLPADPLAGFLPPNDETHRGEGHVTFTIVPQADPAPGTELTNTASIVFDTNDPIATNTVLATIRFPGDMSCDGDVDLRDYASLVACLAGPELLIPHEGCTESEFAYADLDADGDVDLGDFAAFGGAFHPSTPGDVDGDGDVDLTDFTGLPGCLFGPGLIPAPAPPGTTDECMDGFDFDTDGDVDLADFAGFQIAFMGQR